MTLLDIAGKGLFESAPDFTGALLTTLKLVAGSVGILVLVIITSVIVAIRSVIVAVRQSSLNMGFRALLNSAAYAIGVSVALLFLLFASTLLSVSFLKLAVVAVIIALAISWLARETFMFLLLKRFGKYILYLSTLRRVGKAVYTNYGKQENNQINPES